MLRSRPRVLPQDPAERPPMSDQPNRVPYASPRDDGWYWVRKKGWGEDYEDWTPALWQAEHRSWRSAMFSGIPDSEMIVGDRMEPPIVAASDKWNAFGNSGMRYMEDADVSGGETDSHPSMTLAGVPFTEGCLGDEFEVLRTLAATEFVVNDKCRFAEWRGQRVHITGLHFDGHGNINLHVKDETGGLFDGFTVAELSAPNPSRDTREHGGTRFEVQTYSLCESWQNCWTLTDGDDEEEDRTGAPERFASAGSALEALESHLRDINAAVTAGNMTDAPALSEFRIVDLEKGLAYVVEDAGNGKFNLGAETVLRDGEYPRTFDKDVIDGSPERFDGTEIHGVCYVGDTDVEVNDENPDFYSTYVHLKSGGVACVGDFPSLPMAQAHAELLNDRYGWPVHDFAEKSTPVAPRAKG